MTRLMQTCAPALGRRRPGSAHRFAVLAGAGATAILAACSDKSNSTGPGSGAQGAYVRVVSSAFQATDDAGSDNPAGCPCTPLAIDLLFDSATTAPSVMGLAGDTISAGTAGPPPANLNALYTPIATGVHSFVARAAGGANPTFFTTPATPSTSYQPAQYLPKQFLTDRTYYTFVVAGVNPVQPDSGPAVLATSRTFADYSQFPLYVDDPFTPPTVQVSGKSVLQARLNLINAAPFVLTGRAGGRVRAYITPASVIPDASVLESGALAETLDVGSHQASVYINVTADVYELTLATSDGVIVYQAPLTLGTGEVRTLIVQNTLPAGVDAIPAGGVPAESATEYFKVTNVLNNQFK